MLLFRRMLSLLKPHWLLFAGAWLSLILSTGANLVSPMILRNVMDDGISARAWTPILSGTLLLIGLAVVRGIFGFTQSYWSEKVSQSFAFDLRNKLFEKIQTLSFAYHD
ncbi:MAG: ABC transporter ATP-binding protein, partial [Chloroflexia bacterium]|nr:ABC transporter ATP-binding protein [Chloroflexia bacterium]